jgi:hypothetical protein
VQGWGRRFSAGAEAIFYNPDDNPQIFRTTEQQQQNFVV